MEDKLIKSLMIKLILQERTGQLIKDFLSGAPNEALGESLNSILIECVKTLISELEGALNK